MIRGSNSSPYATRAAGSTRRANRYRYLGLAGTLGLGIALSISAFLVALEREEQRIKTQFEWLAIERALSVEDEIFDELEVLSSVAALFGASEVVEQDEFATFADAVLSRHLGVRALAWAPQETSADRSVRFPLRYVEPAANDGGALGYDLGEWSTWREELDRALDTTSPMVTRRLSLARLTLGSSRFVALLPILSHGSHDRTPRAHGKPEGFLVGVFDASRIVESALAPFNSSPVGIDVALYDHADAVEGALLYDRPSARTTQLPKMPPNDHALRQVRTFQAGGREWAVACTAAPQYLVMHPIREPWIVLAIGFVATSGLTLFVWSLIRRAEDVEMIVKQRTAELSRANEQLGDEIVERSRAEEALRQAHESLELRVEQRTADLSRVVGELERANHLKSEFVSTMSHELRTPLNVILGFVEMARDSSFSTEEQQEFFDRIETAGHELLEMVQSTLNISKLEAGRDEPVLRPVSLRELWAAFERDCACLSRAAAVSLDWRGEVPDIVFATDSRKLAVAIRNLVGNALKFTERGKVTVSARREREGLSFHVEDTGVGIRADDLEAIFEMFRQVDGSDSRAHGGTGLGLYIARRVVEQLGGRIAVESRIGYGSVFTVVLPLAAAMCGDPTGVAAPAV